MAPRKEVLSINGYPVLKAGDARLHTFTIPGTSRKATLRMDVGPYLVAFASEYHRLVRKIDDGILDDWSWSPLRNGRASDKPSNHCSGTALDLNATREGSQGPTGRAWWKANPVKLVALNRLKKKYRLLAHGIDWKRFYDPMHHEIASGVSPVEVAAEMKRLGIDVLGRMTGQSPVSAGSGSRQQS